MAAAFEPEDPLVGQIFLHTSSISSFRPWPCICLKSTTATTPELQAPPGVLAAFHASSCKDKVLILYFPIPQPVSLPFLLLGRLSSPPYPHLNLLSSPTLQGFWAADQVGGGVCQAAGAI